MDGTLVGPYLLGAPIGVGKFGTVYNGVHRQTGAAVAIKVEADDGRQLRLPTEASVYRSLGRKYRPRMRWFGRAHGHVALAMDRLGMSLRRAQQRKAGMRLDLDVVVNVGLQVLKHLELLHSKGFLHLDVKPAK